MAGINAEFDVCICSITGHSITNFSVYLLTGGHIRGTCSGKLTTPAKGGLSAKFVSYPTRNKHFWAE